MQWSRLGKAAGLVAPVMVAAVLAGQQPAAAAEGIGVDAAICLQNAVGTLTSPRPVIIVIDEHHTDYAVLSWSATVQTTACSSANARLFLVPEDWPFPLAPVPAAGSAQVLVPGLWTLRLQTMVGGSKDLASITVTVA